MSHALIVSNNNNNNNNNEQSSNSSNNNNNHTSLSQASQYGKCIIKAQLPNQERTTVSQPPGMTIREALTKKLGTRYLEPDMCIVYRLGSNGQAKQRIDWDCDVAHLKGDEIVVETKDRIPMHTQLSHNFAKSFLTLSKCHFCQEFLLTGIRCLTCGIEFHPKCASSVPKLCEPAIEHSNYYRHLLARSSGFSPTNTLSTSESPTNTNRTIRQRARSADENSKYKQSKNASNQSAAAAAAAAANANAEAGNGQGVVEQANGNNNHHQHHGLSSKNNPNSDRTYADAYHERSSHANHAYHHHNYTSPTSGTNPHSHFGAYIPSNINYESHHQPMSPKEIPQSGSNRELLEERWEIDGDEIEREQRIGQGSFATVYKGKWHGPVALKELKVKDPTPAQLQDFKNEVVVLKKTRHANVLLFIGYVLKPKLTIVTQWCKGRSLYKHLHVEERRDFNNNEIKTIAMGVAQGMEYLHAKHIIHRDLKSNNIFIHDEDDLTVKIGDFGLATFKTRWEGEKQIYHPTGSILWMAPEVISVKPGVNPFTYQSDVYSYGIVLYELLSRKLPYFDFKHKDALLFLIGYGDPKTAPKLNLDVIKEERPEDMKSLMLNCIARDSNERPLFTKIIKDLKKIKSSKIPRSSSEPLRLNDLNGSLALLTLNY